MVAQIAISPDSKFMVAGSSEEIVIWKFAINKEMGITKPEWIKQRVIESGAVCVCFSSDSRHIATGDRLITLWNAETG